MMSGLPYILHVFAQATELRGSKFINYSNVMLDQRNKNILQDTASHSFRLRYYIR